MKSMFYVGAALMLGASVYGFVDYRNSKSKKEFKELYTKTEATVEVAKPDPAGSEEIAPEQETTKAGYSGEKKSAKVEKTKSAAAYNEVPSKVEEITVVSPEKPAVVKKNKHGKKKKLDYKLFSRAAPSEDFKREAAKAEKQ